MVIFYKRQITIYWGKVVVNVLVNINQQLKSGLKKQEIYIIINTIIPKLTIKMQGTK